jgi:predicted ester cyclase
MKRLFSISLLILFLAVFTFPATAQENVVERNKETLRNGIAEFNAGNPQGLYNIFPEEFLMNQGSATLEPMLRADVAGYNDTLLGAMPDLQMTINVLIGQGDWLATQITSTGTFTEPLDFGEEFPPTSETVTWTEIDFFHFDADGNIIELWGMSDPAILFTQLGIFPAEEGDASGTPLDLPAGYQLLTTEEWAATFTSGMEERNIGLLNEQLDLTMDPTPYYTDPYITWSNGSPFSVSAAQQLEETAFPAMIASAMPDYTFTADVVVAEGDWVAALGTIRGTFTVDVDFFGTPLTHTDQEIVWQLGVIDRYTAEGQIVEEWVELDVTPLLVGFGLITMDEE